MAEMRQIGLMPGSKRTAMHELVRGFRPRGCGFKRGSRRTSHYHGRGLTLHRRRGRFVDYQPDQGDAHDVNETLIRPGYEGARSRSRERAGGAEGVE